MGFREEDSFGVVAVVVGSGDGASAAEWVEYRAGEIGGIGGAAGPVCGRGEAVECERVGPRPVDVAVADVQHISSRGGERLAFPLEGPLVAEAGRKRADLLTGGVPNGEERNERGRDPQHDPVAHGAAERVQLQLHRRVVGAGGRLDRKSVV